MNDRIIGIIGGMGPEATADLYMKIIKATKASKDQEHFHVIIDGNAKIPDRTAAILGAGDSPEKALAESAKNLELMGADIACIPCITAHYFLENIQKEVSYRILNALEEVRNHIDLNYPSVDNIGILATSGTIRTGLFEKYLRNYKIIYPAPGIQEEMVMKVIYGVNGIKSGNREGEPLQMLKTVSNGLAENGAGLLIAGCTEIGMVLKPHHISIPLVDPMEIIAGVITA